MTPKELREKRAEIAKAILALRDAGKGRDFKAEERSQWDELNTKYNELSAAIQLAVREEVAAQIEGEQEEPAETAPAAPAGGGPAGAAPAAASMIPGNARGDATAGPEGRADPSVSRRAGNLAMQAWMRVQAGSEPTQAERNACEQLNFNPGRRHLDIAVLDTDGLRAFMRNRRNGRNGIDQRASMGAVTGSTGGYFVPEGFVASFEQALLAYGGMLNVAEVIRTDSGNDIPWPTVNDTSNEGEQIGESVSIGPSVPPAVGRILFGAYKFHSKALLVARELLEDAAIDVPSLIGEMLGTRLGRVTNSKCTTGTGAGTIRGVVTGATLGKTAASSTAIAASELLDLIHSVDPAYRENARFMMHDAIILHVRKLVGGDGQFLWQPSMQDGVPDRLHGFPVTVNQNMASSIASAAKTVLFGDLSKYKVRQVRGIRFVRMEERYADTDEVGFDAFLRQDGNLIDAGTHPVKYLQQT